MENQANIREFFNKIQAAAASNAPLPWELLHTSASASRAASTSNLSRNVAYVGEDYGVGLPPMAGY